MKAILYLLIHLATLLITLISSVLYGQENQGLTKEIQVMDSILFDAFNNKDIEKIKTLFSDDLEFYHDKGGVSNYGENIKSIQAIFNNPNSAVSRTAVEGSFEVYPIANYGAVQTGKHKFCNTENGSKGCSIFKFVHLWEKTGEGWKVARVISYDHQTIKFIINQSKSIKKRTV